MGLKIKSFAQVLRGMVDWVTTNTGKITDFHVGSAIRTLLEAIASEIEQMYYAIYKNVHWAIENSIYHAFDFVRFPARSSYGTLTVAFASPLPGQYVIPKGTKFATSTIGDSKQIFFITKEDYVVAEGSDVADITVYCTEPGTIGNVSADSITIMVNPIHGVIEVRNKSRFTNGQNEESLADRKKRFTQYINSLSKGTKKAIEYGVRSVEGVTGVYVDDSMVGVVFIYAHDSDGELTDELQERILVNLKDYRAAGIPCLVFPVPKREIDINVVITVQKEYNNNKFKEEITNALTDYVNGIAVAKDFYVTDLITFLKEYNDFAVLSCKFISPPDDIITGKNEILRVRDIVVTLKNNS